MTATFAAWGGTVASDVYAFADADEGCRIVERLRAAQATLGDTGQVDLDATGDLQNHVVGFTRVPHLPVDVERDVAAALAEREAESLTALLQLRLAAPWGGLLVDFSHSEEEWWHEHHFATGLYERHGATTDARLYSFIDRLHETAIDRLVRQLAVDVR
jgi:hypothetical protein